MPRGDRSGRCASCWASSCWSPSSRPGASEFEASLRSPATGSRAVGATAASGNRRRLANTPPALTSPAARRANAPSRQARALHSAAVIQHAATTRPAGRLRPGPRGLLPPRATTRRRSSRASLAARSPFPSTARGTRLTEQGQIHSARSRTIGLVFAARAAPAPRHGTWWWRQPTGRDQHLLERLDDGPQPPPAACARQIWAPAS
jgi:hypothetical protein